METKRTGNDKQASAARKKKVVFTDEHGKRKTSGNSGRAAGAARGKQRTVPKRRKGKGRHKPIKDPTASVSHALHRKIDQANEDQNVGTQAANFGSETGEEAARAGIRGVRRGIRDLKNAKEKKKNREKERQQKSRSKHEEESGKSGQNSRTRPEKTEEQKALPEPEKNGSQSANSAEGGRRGSRVREEQRSNSSSSTGRSRKPEKTSKSNQGTNGRTSASRKIRTGPSEANRQSYSRKIQKRPSSGTEKKTSISKGEMLRRRKAQGVAMRQKKLSEAGRSAGRAANSAREALSNAAAKVAEWIGKHMSQILPVVGIAVLLLMIVLIVVAFFDLAGTLISGGGEMATEGSYGSEDATVIANNNTYLALEEDLKDKIANVKTDHSGCDEYNINADTSQITHDGYELAALIAVLYGGVDGEDMTDELQEIFDYQYTWTVNVYSDTRTTDVPVLDPDTGQPTYDNAGNLITTPQDITVQVCDATLSVRSWDEVLEHFNLSENQKERYDLLVEEGGGSTGLFDDRGQSEPIEYEVPSEALTDQQFARILNEAEKYLGMAYVWSGSSPSTGFDCSGFVCWVLNHSGYSVGRTSCDGLLSYCSLIRSEEAEPGDLIFFQGTYSTTDTTSHVGIYVGDGMMIHCGDPIQYTSINSSYWQEHFYSFGRLK